jgi:hypothetical protein
VYGARFVSLVHIRKSLERNVFIILLIAKAEKNSQMEMKKNISNPKSKECAYAANQMCYHFSRYGKSLVFKEANSKRKPLTFTITKSIFNFKI